jgi:glycosyltransferase involved in cell wall biosynthesis
MDSLAGGGAERSTSFIWYHLRKENVQFKLVFFKRTNEGFEEEIINEGFDCVFLNGSLRHQILGLRKVIIDYEPDLVHSILIESNFKTRIAKLISSRKFIHLESMVNFTYDKSRFNDPKVNKIKLYILQAFDWFTQKIAVDHFQANGKYVASHFINKIGVSEEKITIINRGRHENKFLKKKNLIRQQVREEFNLHSDVKIIVNVGRHEFQKGHDILLKAFKLIIDKNTNCHLLIVGKQGNNTKNIKEMISSLNLQDNVILTGHRSDVNRILVASDLFIFPSRFEGLSGAIIEAMSSSLPIVCSNIPTLKEVVVSDEGAIFVPLHDIPLLAESSLELLKDQNKMNEMGAQNLKIFEANYNLDIINSKMLALYRILT